MYSWPAERDRIYVDLKAMGCVNMEAVIAEEDKNWETFICHPELLIPEFKSHQAVFEYAFGDDYYGAGVLDIGTGQGVFLLDYLTAHFMPPRVGTDVFKPVVPPVGWVSVVLSGQDLLAKVGENAVDHVQCIETLEHVDPEGVASIAKDMQKICRRSCLITSMGISHHVGEENVDAVSKNKHLAYKGQPGIEVLLNLGYRVRLVNNYQILAWFLK